MEGQVQMAKIQPDLKQQLKIKAESHGTTMTELVKQQLRLLQKQNGLPTI